MAKSYLRDLVTTLIVLLQIHGSHAQQTQFNVLTTAGEVSGFINSTSAPNVVQFLGVPFAEDPIGKLRFSAPVPKSPSAGILNATKFSASCPQYNTSVPTFFSVAQPEYYIEGPTAEECLTLNIWTPLPTREAWEDSSNNSQAVHQTTGKPKNLPVIIFFHGGQFILGGSRVAYHKPHRWVERSQQHVAVSINYRVNIFGFPNARGINSSSVNLGFLDQRMAVQWVESNIAAFGGDPSRITLFGQSAGAVGVDAYNLAYPNDSNVTGYIMDSGTAWLPTFSQDKARNNFTFVAEKLGCKNSTGTAELDCVRGIPFERLESFLKGYQDNGTTPTISFLPVQDDVTFFTDPAARAKQAQLKKPAIIGTAANEGASLARPYTPSGPSKVAAQAITSQFLCSTVKTRSYRYAQNLTTYPYYYMGNFTNISPLQWEGAYHSSELPVLFQVASPSRGNPSDLEVSVGHRMQG
ncbi:gb [Venturia nashicola]|nr:gb [Venturia nashicola]